MFDKILIANRGEIACRIIDTARRNGIATVAVYSEADSAARHVRRADEAHLIGGAAARDSYLRADTLIEVAAATGAQAIHPGYGFLSENAEFAEACEAAGLVFIGPGPESIRAMGLKDRAKELMARAGVPVVPGYQGADQTPEILKAEADGIGYPVLIKAVAGGGGKGMRLVERADEFLSALESCQREAEAAFGNAQVLIEKFLTKPRHIEVQVFADSHGEAIYLYERDCSLQRRHQKVVEEAPAPGLSPDLRRAMGEAAVKAAKAIGYCGAGTIEFIVDGGKGLTRDSFYFMEMNTRLQVEHPVTELVTGQDLVDWQLRIAAGERLPLTQEEIPLDGHAFEVRLYAEDPAGGFLPQTGRLHHFSTPPPGRHFRLDSGVEQGDEVSVHYDPMIAKLIVWDRDRPGALRQMRRVLRETAVAGLKTNLEFLGRIFNHDAFAKGEVDTGFISRFEQDLIPQPGPVWPEILALAALNELMPDRSSADVWDWTDGWRLNMALTTGLTFVDQQEKRELHVTYEGQGFRLLIDGREHEARLAECRGDEYSILFDGHKVRAKIIRDGQDLTIFQDGRVFYLHHYLPGAEAGEDMTGSGVITTPMPGRLSRLMVAEGDRVEAGQPLLILEAMKMEHTLKAPLAGSVEKVAAKEGAQVTDGQLLVKITEDEA